MQVKTALRLPIRPVRMAMFKKSTEKINASKDARGRNHYPLLVGLKIGLASIEKSEQTHLMAQL